VKNELLEICSMRVAHFGALKGPRYKTGSLVPASLVCLMAGLSRNACGGASLAFG